MFTALWYIAQYTQSSQDLSFALQEIQESQTILRLKKKCQSYAMFSWQLQRILPCLTQPFPGHDFVLFLNKEWVEQGYNFQKRQGED